MVVELTRPRPRKARIDSPASLLLWERTTVGSQRVIMTPSGHPFALEQTYTGPLPEEAKLAAWTRKQRYVSTAFYGNTFGKWLPLAIKVGPDVAFQMLDADERKALVEGVDERGGVLAVPDFTAALFSALAALSLPMQLADVQPTNSDRLLLPWLESGLDWAATGETHPWAESDLRFGIAGISVRDFIIMVRAPDSWAADMALTMDQIAQAAAARLAVLLNYEFIRGPGTGLHWWGFSVRDGIASTTLGAGTIDDPVPVRALKHSLPAAYAGNASWVMSSSAAAAAEELLDADGRPLFQVGRGSFDNAPLYESDELGPNGTAGIAAAYGDFRAAYVVAQRQDVTLTVLNERFIDTGEVGIVIKARLGGAVVNPDAIRLGVLA